MGRSPRLRAFAGLLAGALLLLEGLALPFLERGETMRLAAFETHHTHAACAPIHDHSVCTRIGADHAAPSPRIRLASAFHTPVISIHASRSAVPARMAARAHHSRAPPIA